MIDVVALWELARTVAIGTVGSGLLAAIVGGFVAGWYRSRTKRAPPAGTVPMIGLAAVTGYWLVVAATTGSIVPGAPLEHQLSAGMLLATVAVAGVAGTVGGRFVDRLACQVGEIPRLEADGEPAAAVRDARLAVSLELPATIDDAEGYRPVDESTTRRLSGTTIELPHALSIDERRDRIERQLTADYDIDYTDVTMAEDGTVDRVLVGRHAPGLGTTVPPKTVGVAIRAECPSEASLGDSVEIWSTAAGGRLLATGTLRATDGSIATVVVDADRTPALADDERYRLVTRPAGPTGGYEFASTLHALEATVSTITVEPDGDLVGEFVGWLPGRVLVIDRDDDLLAVPETNEPLRAGDTCWVLAHPDELTDFDPTTPAVESGHEPPQTAN
ncbi:hypothetical protein D8Y22_03685 [Salinadaptatus halalkaliphilus]|uniref:RCK C-terminal domain-containing protein n=1 Tax=Salinadaptatus halalkaliphilus TaxID=2419781 RepID=A0A4S3TP93_9EURY|nr:hypothetical protein [Salinadaptatus halalkaliphilus]THE66036.1 hypothetical protein D8Y22_03685 [Salinadaptatus halalkaliphilus]